VSAPAAAYSDRLAGALVGAALGDALGMPVEGISHSHVRLYYKGIREMTADTQRRDLAAGQGTADTQRMRALARALTAAPPDAPAEVAAAFAGELAALGDLRRPEVAPAGSSSAAACAAPLGVQARLRGLADLAATRWAGLVLAPVDAHPASTVAATAVVAALREALAPVLPADPGAALLGAARHAAATAERLLGTPSRVSTALDRAALHLREVPMDLHDALGGAGPSADGAAVFALAMAVRGPAIPEATLLSAINAGGDASAVGAITGALLGALHGASVWPTDWLDVLEDADGIRAEAHAMADALVGT